MLAARIPQTPNVLITSLREGVEAEPSLYGLSSASLVGSPGGVVSLFDHSLNTQIQTISLKSFIEPMGLIIAPDSRQIKAKENHTYFLHDIGKILDADTNRDLVVSDGKPSRLSQFLHVVQGASLVDSFLTLARNKTQQLILVNAFVVNLMHHYFCHYLEKAYPRFETNLPEFSFFSRSDIKSMIDLANKLLIAQNQNDLQLLSKEESKPGMLYGLQNAMFLSIGDTRAALGEHRSYRPPFTPSDKHKYIFEILRARSFPKYIVNAFEQLSEIETNPPTKEDELLTNEVGAR
jgi:hypothetical protein